MAVRTREEYVDSLRKQNPVIYMDGERVENIVDHPAFQTGLNSLGVTYDSANDPRYRDLATVKSPLIDEEISRWTHLMQDEADARAKVKLMQALGDYMCPCHYRCMTTDVLHAAWAVSYDIDEKYGTSYHQNMIEITKRVQSNDWAIGGGVVSPKGDRSKGAREQADPDMHLHVVEKKKDGIIVRGAKAHGTAAPYTNILCIVEMMPEPEYFVGFFTPLDTEGMTLICKAAHGPSEPKELENPLSSKFGGHVEAIIIFEDVFVPWENVFMCGESEFLLPYATILASNHLSAKCLCRSTNMNLSIGATALIADYNGLEGAPHIQDGMNEMAMDAEILYSCAMAAAVEGSKHASGVYVPRMAPLATGKVHSARKLGEHRYYMQDVAGGLVATMASEKDYRNPATAKYLEKYYKGREGVSSDDRVRAFKLMEDLTASEFAGWYHAMCVSGGGAAQGFKAMVGMECGFEKCKGKAKRAAGIEE